MMVRNQITTYVVINYRNLMNVNAEHMIMTQNLSFNA